MTLSAKLNHLPPVRPLASADTMRSVQIDASAQPISRWRASVPCVAFAGTPGTAACVIFGVSASNFLPPFPRGGFAARPSRGVCRSGTMKVLTPLALTRTTGLSAYSASPSRRSDPNHASPPMVAFPQSSQRQRLFQASPLPSRLATDLRRIGFVLLQTDGSPPAAPHPAARRRSCLRLQSYDTLWRGLPPRRQGVLADALDTRNKSGHGDPLWILSGRTGS